MTKFIAKYKEFGKEKEFAASDMLSVVMVLKNAAHFQIWKDVDGNRTCIAASRGYFS